MTKPSSPAHAAARPDSTGVQPADPTTPPTRPSITARFHDWAPIATLVVLAPTFVEMLSGAGLGIQHLLAFPRDMIWTYGAATLLIRAVARRYRLGWGAIFIMALALMVSAEFIWFQTATGPLFGQPIGAPIYGGHVFGVDWVWELWALGHESMAMLIAIQFTELLFPGSRHRPWIGRNGALAAVAAFAIASPIAWYYSCYHLRQAYYGHYTPPPLRYLVTGAVITVALATWLMTRPPQPEGVTRRVERRSPAPFVVGMAVTVAATAWESLELFAFGSFPQVPPAVTFSMAAIVAILILVAGRRWTNCATWNDRHRFALVCGSLITCMAFGLRAAYTFDRKWPPATTVQVSLDLILALVLVSLGARLSRPDSSFSLKVTVTDTKFGP